MKFHENLPGEICSCPCRWTDRQTGGRRDMMKLMVTFRNCFVNTAYWSVNMGGGGAAGKSGNNEDGDTVQNQAKRYQTHHWCME